MFYRLVKWRQSHRGEGGVYDTPMRELARMADDIEAGRVRMPPRWKLERPGPDLQVWTTPAGRNYACDRNGRLLPLPEGKPPIDPGDG